MMQQGNQSIPAAGGSSAGSLTANSATRNVFAADPLWGGGVKGGAITYCDASWTSGTKTLTINNYTLANDQQFTTAMNGWKVFGTNQVCYGFTQNAVTQVPLGTLTVAANGNTATNSINSTNTCTSTSGSAVCELVIYPQDDTAAINAAWNAVILGSTTTQNCSTLVLPNTNFTVSGPILGPGSFTSPCGYDNTSNGVQLGPRVEGQGSSASTIIPVPGFDAGTCDNNDGCFFANRAAGSPNNNTYLERFQIFGAGSAPANPAGKCALSGFADSVFVDVGVNEWQIGTGFCFNGGDGAPTVCDRCYDFGGGNTYLVQVTNSAYLTHSIFFWSNASIMNCTGTANIAYGKVETDHVSFGLNLVSPLINISSTCIWDSDGDFFNQIQQTNSDGILCSGDCQVAWMHDQ